MNLEEQRRSLIAFFLGTTAANLDKNHPGLVPIAGRRAYRDLSRTLHGIGSHPEADSLRQDTYESLQTFVGNLRNVRTADEFDHQHDDWCNTAIARFAEATSGHDIKLHYGQAQKWLNMTLKYLAILDHDPVAHVYQFMHVPIDNVIYEQAEQIGAKRGTRKAWSRLDREGYLEYQSLLKDRVSSEVGKDCIPMDWETEAWIERAPLGDD